MKNQSTVRLLNSPNQSIRLVVIEAVSGMALLSVPLREVGGCGKARAGLCQAMPVTRLHSRRLLIADERFATFLRKIFRHSSAGSE